MAKHSINNELDWNIGNNKPITINDKRDDLPIFVHSELDDAPITSDAFRVYAHLARRRNKEKGFAWPSYLSMGEQCFGADYKEGSEPQNASLRRRVIRAVKELEFYGLILKEPSEEYATNSYQLTPRGAWNFSERYVYKADPSKRTWEREDAAPSDHQSLVTTSHPPSDHVSPPSDHQSPKGTTYKGATKESSQSPALSGRGWSQPAPKRRYGSLQQEEGDYERVEPGHENDDPWDSTKAIDALEHLVLSLCHASHISKTNRRKLHDPVNVLRKGIFVKEPSPAEEMDTYPEEFEEWVKSRVVFLRNNGGVSVAKLCNILTKYETPTYGWLAVRPKPDYDAHDPDAPWNK